MDSIIVFDWYWLNYSGVNGISQLILIIFGSLEVVVLFWLIVSKFWVPELFVAGELLAIYLGVHN